VAWRASSGRPWDESNGADAMSLLTLWRALPKLEFDQNATNVPASKSALEAEHISIKDLFEVLGVHL
jgi:hypothetical protein